jgi:hypothetical protein
MPQSRFTKADVARCLRAAKDEGFDRVEINLIEGKIMIINTAGKPVADNPLDQWMAKRAHKVEGR